MNFFPGCDVDAQATVDQIVELGGDAIAVAADCTKPEQLSKMFDQIIDHYGKVDGTLLCYVVLLLAAAAFAPTCFCFCFVVGGTVLQIMTNYLTNLSSSLFFRFLFLLPLVPHASFSSDVIINQHP